LLLVGAACTDHVQFDSYYVAPAVMPLAHVQGSSSGKLVFLLSRLQLEANEIQIPSNHKANMDTLGNGCATQFVLGRRWSEEILILEMS